MFLTTHKPQAVWISSIRPSLEVAIADDQHWRASGRGEWNVLRYSEEALDALEQIYQGDVRYGRERWQFSVSGGYRRQTTLTAELGEAGVLAQIYRTQWQVAPTWSYQLTPKMQFDVNYSFLEAEYERKKNAFVYIAYRYHSASASLRYALTSKLEVFVTPFANFYETIDLPQRTNTYGVQLGGQYAFSDTLSFSLMGGGRYAQSSAKVPVLGFGFDPRIGFFPRFGQQRLDDSDLGFVFSASVQKKLEKGSLSGQIGQQLMPVGVGGVAQQLSAELYWSYDWTEKIRTNVRLVALRNETVSGESTRNQIDRDYFSAQPEIRWRWTEEFSVGLGYSFYYQKFKAHPEPGIGHEVIVNFIYQPQREL